MRDLGQGRLLGATVTVIVCDRKSMACDSRMSFGTEFATCDDKVQRIGNELLGCAGSTDAIFKFIEWYRTKGDRPEMPDDENFEIVVLNAKGIWLYVNSLYPIKILEPFYAAGAGSKAGKAAMLCGKTPKEAVAIAIKCDSSCAGPVRTYNL
jgi:hypothetical protein